MHRSPRGDFDQDGKPEMFLKLLLHRCAEQIPGLGDIEIEQNFSVPNDGIVKSHGEGANDFPATAIWRVAWRFRTRLGTFLSDPKKPLVFGPGRVTHYPPVGTDFRSPTGPVDLLDEATGAKVGSLTPERLTAFDIIVTRDDDVPEPYLSTPPAAIFELLAQF